MRIIKRNGSEATFSKSNIVNAISKACQKVKIDQRFTMDEIKEVALEIETKCKAETHAVNVEDIQEMVENAIMSRNKFDLAKEYITFRYKRAEARQKNTTDDKILSLLDNNNEEINQENANKDPTILNVQRDYMAGEVSKDIARRYLIPEDIYRAHKEGIIHFHDMDYFANRMYNCALINLDDMLQNGTILRGRHINKPHTFSTACNVASQIAAAVCSSQYGGQTFSVAHLSKFVEESRSTFEKRYVALKEKLSEDDWKNFIQAVVDRDVKDGVQILNYQLNTLVGTNGQAPFISFGMYLDEAEEGVERDNLAKVINEIFTQRIAGFPNEKGVMVTQEFPKLLYFLDEDNIHDDSPYFWLTKKAIECTSKRMVPDYISAKKMRELKDGNVFPCMGCRSFLQPYYEDKNGKPTTKKKGTPKFWSRFNQGVCTINLPDVALCAKKDMEKFWLLLDDRLELCHRALRLRHERLRGTLSDVAPELWQGGAIARLKPGETIDKLLYNDYSSISLGYVGLCECVTALIGKPHYADEEASALGKAILERMNEKCNQWKQIENIGYSIYGTPEESTTYKFAQALQKRHGIIPGVTDKNYVTNSYHVHVTHPINAFDKLTFESEFQALSTGGAISYVETKGLDQNPEAALALIRHMYDTIMYAEINLHLSYCKACGYEGRLNMPTIDGKILWQCPQCNCLDQQLLHPTVRVCGYIASKTFNQGRTQEIKERVLHC